MSANLKAVLVWVVIFGSWLLLILLTWGLEMGTAGADDHDYDQQLHQGSAVPGDNLDGCVVADLDSPCVPIPAAMFRGIERVQNCESGGWWSKAATPGQLVSPNGLYYGSLQLDKRHGMAMAAAGLDWSWEDHRLMWAVKLWERWGWSLWPHCGKLG